MKAFCNYTRPNINPELCFSSTHMFDTFRRVFPCQKVLPAADTTHYLIMDVDPKVYTQMNDIMAYRKQGLKVVLMVFDPAWFPMVDIFISNKMLDKVVVFDGQYKDRFNCNTFVSDYFFNDQVFPITSAKPKSGVCVFGHLEHGRVNDYNVPRVDTDPLVQSYSDLYKSVQNYNGVAIYDTGLDERRSGLIHHNKAKAVETLMCGRNPYCQDGIKTKRYDKFLYKYSEIPTPREIVFSQEEIFRINNLTVRELIYECEYV